MRGLGLVGLRWGHGWIDGFWVLSEEDVEVSGGGGEGGEVAGLDELVEGWGRGLCLRYSGGRRDPVGADCGFLLSFLWWCSFLGKFIRNPRRLAMKKAIWIGAQALLLLVANAIGFFFQPFHLKRALGYSRTSVQHAQHGAIYMTRTRSILSLWDGILLAVVVYFVILLVEAARKRLAAGVVGST
jgi:hypothetical protein